MSNVRLHDFRHTYASMALPYGETALTIGRLFGHSRPETTLKYAPTGWSEKRSRRSAQRWRAEA